MNSPRSKLAESLASMKVWLSNGYFGIIKIDIYLAIISINESLVKS
jgi:hypothetical protein